jgi:hypothetical protein
MYVGAPLEHDPLEQLGTMMPHPTHPNDFQIDRVHSGAVCKEIGDRLSVALGPQSVELPPRLLALIDQPAKIGPHEDFRFRPD